MDTYGHLFPDQEADAVDRMRQMLVDHQTAPETLRAIATDDHTANGAQQLAPQLARETQRSTGTGCETERGAVSRKKTPKPLHIGDLGDSVQCSATKDQSSGGGIRTPDTRIMIPLL